MMGWTGRLDEAKKGYLGLSERLARTALKLNAVAAADARERTKVNARMHECTNMQVLGEMRRPDE